MKKEKKHVLKILTEKLEKNEPLFVMIEGNVIISGEFENLADLHARTAAGIAHLMLSLEMETGCTTKLMTKMVGYSLSLLRKVAKHG
ncbi:hypothetical protein [Phascolarctobacterium faecium]|jgi:hypothetical protein|uniref:hypothetical protein n=1 Tax=Phascolarctobacterium faecium TaxID=33025 RepID=UPI003AB45EE2